MSKRVGDSGYAPNWCTHYRYNKNVKKGEPDTCEAGIDYEAWRGTLHDKWPCFLDKGKSKPEALLCPKLRLPTEEEIKAHEEYVKVKMGNLAIAMVGISAWRRKWQGIYHIEIVECPVCKGKLHLAISSYNSHVQGNCETEGCVSWME